MHSPGSRRVSTGKAEGGLTTPQAATLLGVHVATVHKWVTVGRIRAERITPPVGRMYLVLNREDALAGAPGPRHARPWVG